MDIRNPKMYSVPQDTLSDVLTNGPSLKTFEYLTKDSYYSKGLHSAGSPRYPAEEEFTANLLQPLQGSSMDSCCIPGSRINQQSVPMGGSPQHSVSRGNSPSGSTDYVTQVDFMATCFHLNKDQLWMASVFLMLSGSPV